MIDIHSSNVKDYLRNTTERFNFALYDPPYEIAITGKKWDNSGIVFDAEYNKLLFDHMLPGGFVVCYGHARVFHRVMVALEDAGFIVHKSIMAWAYSSGQPQGAPNIIKNIDAKFAAEMGGFCECGGKAVTRQLSLGFLDEQFAEQGQDINICDNCKKPQRKVIKEIQWSKSTGKSKMGGPGFGNDNKQIIAEPMTYEAEILKNYTYGLSAFKPMVEPIIVVQKPFENNDAVGTIVKYGTGIVNVYDTTYSNRWPGNFVGIHDLGCYFDEATHVWRCVDTCELHQEYLRDNTFFDKYVTFSYNDADHSYGQVDKFVVQSKPNKNEKNKSGENPHATVKPIELNTYLGKLFLPPPEFKNPVAFNPFSGSGSEAIGLARAGWKEIRSVEMSEEFAQYSANRIPHFVKESVTLHENPAQQQSN